MSKRIENQRKQCALTLLALQGGKGSHGFKGAQFITWREMRTAMRAALRIIARHGSIDANGREYRRALDAECPRFAVEQWIVNPQNRWTMMMNPKWSGGTRSGAVWSNRVINLICGAADFVR